MDDSQKDEEEGLSLLHIAAARGDTEAVRNLLMSSTTGDVLDTKRSAPSHEATQHSRVDVVDLSLSKNAGVNARSAFGETSLYLAAEYGHLATVQLLLNSCAYVNAVCISQWTPLHLAANFGYADIVHNLIRYGANVNACTDKKVTALQLACLNGHTSIVEILLDNHATVDVAKQFDETPFYIAAACGHADVTDLLLLRGFCEFVLDDRKETPLHRAIRNGRAEVVEVILKHCSRRSRRLLKDRQTLEENVSNLTECSAIQKIQFFRSDGRRVSAGLVWIEENTPLVMRRNSDGDTALDVAVHSVEPKIVKLLLNASKGEYSEEHLGRSFYYLIRLMISSEFTDWKNSYRAAKDLDGDKQDDIVFQKIKEIAQALINSIKFNANHQNEFGQTPLNDVMNNIDDVHSKPGKQIRMFYMIQFLLDNGADFNIQNSDGETPLIIASRQGICGAIQILFDWEQKSGMKLQVDARDKYGETALIKAVDRNNVSVVRLLLKHKASTNLYDYNGLTALHAAVHEPRMHYFDFYFYCKWPMNRNFDGVNSFETSNTEKLRLQEETVDPHNRVIDWLQSHIQHVEKTIRLREEVVEFLLYNVEANVNAIDFRGNTPLDLAMKSSNGMNSVILKALKNRGLIRKSPEDLAPIDVAKVGDRVRISFDPLIDSRILGDFLQCWRSSTDRKQEGEQIDFVVNGILQSRENFRKSASATDSKGRTPLHYAAMASARLRRMPTKCLLETGYEVNAVDMYGKTPLHYADENDRCELLVKLGADEYTKDNCGNTPRDLKQLRDLMHVNGHILREHWSNCDHSLYTEADIAQVYNADQVTELSKRKILEGIRIYSQSPNLQVSVVESIWKIWTKHKFVLLNRRLSQLRPYIQHFMKRLADGMKEKDWRFECQSTLVGSAEEETKIFTSTDFDFNFKLIEFSKICEPFPHPLGPDGYFELRRKKSENTENWSDKSFDSFFNIDHCMLTDEVNSRFKIILEHVLSDPSFWKDEHLFDWTMEHKYDTNGGLCKTVLLRMIHPIKDGEGGFLFVNVSIDIVACIQVEDWWPEDPLPVGINPSVKADGCTFVFHRPHYDVCKPRGTHFFFSESYARISFASLESRVIRDSSPLIKAAYMVCKIGPNSSLFDGAYQLKTSLLFCVEAFNAFASESEVRKDEDITPDQLTFWVERIMFCLMEFSRHGIFPCYFMPSFTQSALRWSDRYTGWLRRKNYKASSPSGDDFCYCAVFGFYLDLCPDGCTFDIPAVAYWEDKIRDTRNLDSNGDPISEQFDREELIRKLTSRRSD